MSSEPKDTGKFVEVEAVAEGPRVKAKRQLSPAQLENLRKGRERLAEKRKKLRQLQKIHEDNEDQPDTDEDEEKVIEEVAQKDTSDTEDETEDEMLPDDTNAVSDHKNMTYQEEEHVYPPSYCSIM